MFGLAFVVGIMGCAKPVPPPDIYEGGGRQAAIDQQRAEALVDDRDRALDNLRLASMALAMGDRDEGEAALRRAVGPMTTFQADGEFASRIGAEDRKEWKGEPYEKMAAFTTLGMVLWSGGDTGNALAMFKSAVLADTGTQQEAFRSDFLPGWVLQALVFAEEGERDNAEAALERGIDAYWSRHTVEELTRALEMARVRSLSSEESDAARAAVVAGLSAGVGRAPRDPEAASGLAQALAALYGDDPDLGTPMSKAAERADAAAPDSVAGLQARAAVARASGSGALALDLSMRCGDPPSLAGMAGEGVDLRCALTAAELAPNAGALAALDRRFPDAYPIRAARTETALRTDDLSLAIALGGRLAKDHPKEVVPQAVLAQAYAEAGQFDAALVAATEAGRLDPRRLGARRLRADLLLKQAGRPRDALAEYEGVIAHEAFRRMPDQAQLFADAAAAALAAGASDRAIELADQSLKADSGNPAASLHKARAQVQRSDKPGAEATLRDADLTRISGHQQARYHVGAARVYLELGRERMAVDELANARDADPHWPVAALETARARLRVKNLVGAIELIELVAYLDGLQEGARSPLHTIWYPSTDWNRIRGDLERGLVGDVRFAARGAGVLGVVSWIGGMPGARRELEQAVKNSDEVPAAHAALAQLMMARGDVDAARFHASAVLAAHQDRAVIRAIKGRAMVAQGDAAGGDAELNKALQDDAANPGVRRHLAYTRQQQGDVTAAVEAWRQVQRLSPGDIGARSALLALEQTGR